MNEIDEIRRQMAQIRHDLHQDVSNVVSGVSEVVNEVSGVMDWRSALRGHPYMLVGAALAAGYLIVPRAQEGCGAESGFPCESGRSRDSHPEKAVPPSFFSR